MSASSKLTTYSQIALQAQNVISAVSGVHLNSPESAVDDDIVPKQRTLEDVRLQVARSIAVRAIRKARSIDGSQTGVIFTLNKSNLSFLKIIATELDLLLKDHPFLFALTTDSDVGNPSTLLIVGSSPEFVLRANILTSSKFLGRTVQVLDESNPHIWIAGIHGMGTSSFDEVALRDIVAKSVRNLMEPLKAPPNSLSVDQLVSDARARLERLLPKTAYAELIHDDMPTPVFLIDIRSESQRRQYGSIHGAIVIDRNELEWKLDPRSPARLNFVDRFDLRFIIMSQDGNASSLAAYSLRLLGLMSATDVIGGYLAWKNSSLPTDVQLARSSTVTSYY